jgi:small GTP-binding protein
MSDNNYTSMDSSVISTRFKVVVVGDVSVGKTSFISQLIDNKFSNDYNPSIGVDFASKTIKFRNKIIKLQIWDTAGQEKYKSLIPTYIRGSNLIFIIYDLTSKINLLR